MMETPKLPLVLLSLEEQLSVGIFPGCRNRYQSGFWGSAAGKREEELKLKSQASACFSYAGVVLLQESR